MRTFAHYRKNTEGRLVPSPASAVTVGLLDGKYGTDNGRPLVVRLVPGDLIEFRPLGTRRSLSVEAEAVYHWLIRKQVNAVLLEKARETKAAKARARLRRAEQRLFRN